ncbi:MAG: RNA pyrophosphohydrolase [Rhodospirillales bacterium]|nr:RNA pyrophosphohydrolase [Rhodospirillales bacterium]
METKDLPYRKGVGAIVFDGDGRVLVAKRINTSPEAWQLPQGGIRKDEKALKAIYRELLEEIGTDKVEVLAKSTHKLRYDLPSDIARKIWKGRYRGQEQRWFAFRFLGADTDIDLNASGSPEFDAWRWVDFEELPALAIWFKRSLYEELVAEFHGVVTDLRSKALAEENGVFGAGR